MSTPAVSGTSSSNTQNQAAMTNAYKGLGRDAFLTLLMTQMKNQDPLQPTDDKQFIAQLAQFSALEQTQNMGDNIKSFVESQPILQGANLIGRTVRGYGSDGETQVFGKVDSVKLADGKLILKVGGTEVPSEYVTSIS